MTNQYKTPIVWERDPLVDNTFMEMIKKTRIDSPSCGSNFIIIYRNRLNDRYFMVLGIRNHNPCFTSFTFKQITKDYIEYIYNVIQRKIIDMVADERNEIRHGL